MNCSKCGIKITEGELCAKCEISDEPANDYLQQIFELLNSRSFLLAVVLTTISMVFSAFNNFVSLPLTIAVLAYAALVVIGLWCLYFAGKAPGSYQKLSQGLTFLRIRVILDLVAAILGLLTVPLSLAYGLGRSMSAVVVFVLAVTFFILFIRYQLAVQRIIKDVRTGVSKGSYEELSTLKSFTTLTYLFCGISLLTSTLTMSILDSVLQNVDIGELTEYLARNNMTLSFMKDLRAALILTMILETLKSAGQVIFVLMLESFNKEQKSRMTNKIMEEAESEDTEKS